MGVWIQEHFSYILESQRPHVGVASGGWARWSRKERSLPRPLRPPALTLADTLGPRWHPRSLPRPLPALGSRPAGIWL